MEAFNFYLPTRIIGGRGAVREKAPELLKNLGSRALIITGKSSAKKSGALDDIAAALGEAGVSYELFDGMGENPLVSVCAKAGAAARENGADFIIGIGGGSALDGARASCVFAVNEFENPRDIYKLEFESALPLVTIGTTAGTGSEVDAVSVLTDDETGLKKSVSKPFMFARYAFCDYGYTLSMSLRQTVSTGLDALCHCLESWFSKNSSETSRLFSRRGVELVYPRLVEIASGNYSLQDEALREDLYHGSLWGGFALAGAGAGFPHPAGYPFTEAGIFPHGVACAVFEKAFVEHSLKSAPELWKKQLLDITGGEAPLYAMLDKLTINNVSVSREACETIIERTATNKNAKRALGGFGFEECRAIVESQFLDESQSEAFSGSWLLDR
ncbi:MAG: iron-containing alcohol dehydrogenase [Oscillospiraceae bacterium]|nr:iron-containing alcohol dehydrogenase [Oscillospiraceae bacterium]